MARGRYYEPPTAIRLVDGVTRVPICTQRDEYSGTAEALAAAGLLPLDRFPGMPGQNVVSVALRPFGVGQSCTQNAPGRMWVCRRMNGTYRVQLVVAQEEQDRREAEVEARKRASEEAAEAVLQQVSRPMRKFCEALIQVCGGRFVAERCLGDASFLARRGIAPDMAEQALRSLEVFEQAYAAQKIELGLSPASMTDAKALLDRVSRA